MGTTPRFTLPFPEGSDPFDVQSDLERLAGDVDTAVPRVTQGTGPPPTTGMQKNDIHLVYED